jgi:hypothetical protein
MNLASEVHQDLGFNQTLESSGKRQFNLFGKISNHRGFLTKADPEAIASIFYSLVCKLTLKLEHFRIAGCHFTREQICPLPIINSS